MMIQKGREGVRKRGWKKRMGGKGEMEVKDDGRNARRKRREERCGVDGMEGGRSEGKMQEG